MPVAPAATAVPAAVAALVVEARVAWAALVVATVPGTGMRARHMQDTLGCQGIFVEGSPSGCRSHFGTSDCGCWNQTIQ